MKIQPELMELEKPLSSMDDIFNIGILYWISCQLIIKVNTNWKVKGVLYVIVEMITIYLFHKFDSFYFWRNLALRILALVCIVKVNYF